MGMLTELFRRMKGVHQSLHPTHGVAALGPLAAEMTAGHDRAATPSRERGIAAALAGRAGLDLVCLELGEGVRPDRDELPAAHLVAPDRGAALHALAPRPAAPLESRNGRLTSIAVVCTGIGGGAAGDQVARAGNPAEGLLQARDPPRLAPDRRSAGAPALMGPDARTGRWTTPLALTRHGGRAHRACSGLARENLRTASISGTARSRPACLWHSPIQTGVLGGGAHARLGFTSTGLPRKGCARPQLSKPSDSWSLSARCSLGVRAGHGPPVQISWHGEPHCPLSVVKFFAFRPIMANNFR